MTDSLLPANFDKQVFLRDYWQKKPLLIRAGATPFVDPISPEELAGLACEEGVESRLVRVSENQDAWTLQNGPFSEQMFLDLPETHYSLLVQAVDQWVDDVSAMLADFDFIPGWRIDDVMVSYATDQGNVGPHFDYYDVFLIQGMGQKRWQIGAHCNSLSPRRDDSGLRLLSDFKCEQEWTVNPGDILYLPPGIAHYGVAIADSMTYSVGFRAPSLAEIVSGLADEVLDSLNEDQRYTDKSLQLPTHPGEIGEDVIRNLRQEVLQLFDNPGMIRRWFGKTMTQSKYPGEAGESACEDEHHFHNSTDMRHAIADGAQVYKVPGARFAYALPTEPATEHAELYAAGECYSCEIKLLPLLQALTTQSHTDSINGQVIADCIADDDACELLFTLQDNHCLFVG
jgi:50S ribosomal protein L16 3-hydroxylase